MGLLAAPHVEPASATTPWPYCGRTNRRHLMCALERVAPVPAHRVGLCPAGQVHIGCPVACVSSGWEAGRPLLWILARRWLPLCLFSSRGRVQGDADGGWCLEAGSGGETWNRGSDTQLLARETTVASRSHTNSCICNLSSRHQKACLKLLFACERWTRLCKRPK